jgi:PAS domain S-box-containing protein
MTAEVLAAVFAEAPDAMAVVERAPPFRVRAANARFLESVEGVPVQNRPLLDLIREVSSTALEALLEQVASTRRPEVIMVTSTLPGRRYRHWEITLSSLESVKALLYVRREVTDREEKLRRLETAHARALTVAGLARSADPLAVDDKLSSTASAASALCDGPAAIYLMDATGALILAAHRATSSEVAPFFPEILPDGFSLASEALATGVTRLTPYVQSLPEEVRRLLRQAAASWAAVTPLRGPHGAMGVMLTLWRRPPGPTPGDVPSLDSAAAQLALSLEHSRLYVEVENERARLAAVVDQLPDAVWIADRRGRLTQTNSVGRRIFGLAPDEAIPPLEELAARIRLEEAGGGEPRDLGVTAAIGGRGMPGLLYSVTRPDAGEQTWLQVSAAPLRDREGNVAGAISVATDITTRKRAEEALRLIAETSAALAESLAYEGTLGQVAQLLVPSLADCVLIDLLEPDTTVRRVATACAESIDASLARQLEGDGPDAFARDGGATVLANGGSRLHAELTPSVLSELSRDDAHLRALQEMRLRSYLAVPLVARGRTLGVIQLLRAGAGRRYDVVDRALAEDLGRRAATAIDNARLYQQAQEADRRKDEFLAVLSHELRTPLTPILAWVQIIQHDANPAFVRQAASAIERNVRLQTMLINDLLDLTSIERGKLPLDLKSLDLRDPILSALDTVAESAKRKGINLRHSLLDAAVPVDGDVNRLQQVFWNLLSNAIKFTPARGTVTLQLEADERWAVVSVRDTGTGIARDFLPHVFDMFRQQEQGTRRVYGGLGVGLTLAKRLIERHGGTIGVRSDGIGRGAEFSVRLPLVAASVMADEQLRVPAESSQPRLDGVRILVVEDVADTSCAARLMLESLGARVSVAADGVEALASLASVAPAVVLCDLRMPRMDGFEFLRRLRADPAHRRLPVVAVSGLASQTYRREVEEAGFEGFLSKPFDYDMLARTVAAVVRPPVRARAS